MTEHYREVRRRREAGEPDAPGFTLIELLIVIVVLGILAATVIFALGGVTSQSVSAACNSDAKSVEVAVEAYHSAPGNTMNSYPGTWSDLTGGAFNGPFLRQKPQSSHYTIWLEPSGGVNVGVGGATTDAGSKNYDAADGSFANPCDDPSIAS